VKLTGNGPRALVPIAGGFATACYFSHTLHLLALDKGGKVTVRDIALSPPPSDDIVRRGERIFYDATSCFQHWQSCISCHPGVRTDTLNWDLLNDGIGKPKQTKSLLFVLDTPPAMISGIRDDGQTAIRAGLRYIQFAVRPQEDALAIEAFLRSLKPLPSPALVKGQLSESAQRGKAVFKKAGCLYCHSGPLFTDQKRHDLHSGRGGEKNMKWDTPTLREVWRTAPYLYDGRAATLEEVVGKFNPGDKHGHTSQLSEEERRDLVEYVRSL
jgi:cytochrome c peroxidase